MLDPIPEKGMPSLSKAYKIITSKLLNVEIESNINVRMMYSELGMNNSIDLCYVRKEVLEKLIIAQSSLPEGLFLRIWDAWRPFELQKELFEVYSKKIINKFHLRELSEKDRISVISKYVSVPYFDKLRAPVHTTGGAVDVTLIDNYGCELNMGTGFDSFSPKTHTDYFESTNNEEIKKNRRILYRAMTLAGFTNLPSEWWHYDYGDVFWSYYTESPVMYEGIASLKEVDNIE